MIEYFNSQEPPRGYRMVPLVPMTMLDAMVGVPTNLLEKSLLLKVNGLVGLISITKSASDLLSEVTGEEGFKNLPTIPMWCERTSQDCWKIQVGKTIFEVNKETLEKLISGEFVAPRSRQGETSRN